jgi:hypothetical protein
MSSQSSQSLTALAEEILANAKKYENGKQDDRTLRVRLMKSAQDLQMQLKDPKEATFDHLTHVCRFYKPYLALRLLILTLSWDISSVDRSVQSSSPS